MPRVTALVTHYNRPHLIGDAVQSLLAQTRLPDRIVVMDDCSASSPLAAIPDHPTISVYRSHENVGPYRLIEWAVRQFDSDWYMIQDSDDISAKKRLEHLLQAAEQHGADMVGSALRNIYTDPPRERVKSFVHDASGEHLRDSGPMWVASFGTCIFSRDIWSRIGGFATGLRFSGDVEFTSRACHTGRVINISSVELIRRVQPDSLTVSGNTGTHSPARRAFKAMLAIKSDARKEARAAQAAVDLSPFSTAPEIRMQVLRAPS